MNRKYLVRILAVLFFVVWAVYELYPPTARPLVQYFRDRAVGRDAVFQEIVDRAKAAEKERPERAYVILQEAIGTNDITRYFPFITGASRQARPTDYILNELQRAAAGKIRLGLDLQGGTSFLVRMDTNRLENLQAIESAQNQAVEVLRKRVDRFGVAEPIIQPAGADRILIQLPGLSQSAIENAELTISKVAFLEFRLVHEQSAAMISQGMVAPGYELLTHERVAPNGTQTEEKYLVKKKPEMQGGIKRAGLIRDNLGRPQISFELDDVARDRFGEITTANQGRLLAIVLDGELQSAPVIREPITGGQGTISGDYSEEEAWALANVLENPLKAPLSIEEKRTVDPSLGKDSITSGMTASIIAGAGTLVFMLIFYFGSGMVANIALALNVLFLMGGLCAIEATLTMPGIAGIALTIGMAVDANVLIYERMREEIAAGKSLRGVIAASYQKAFGTILDSHLTTFICALILIYMGSGPVQGFGVTLAIGIFISILTAVLVTRLIYDLLMEKGWLKRIRMLPLMKLPQFSFTKFGKLTCALSALLIIVGFGYGFKRGKGVLGVDFAGGESQTMTFSQRIPVDQLRSTLEAVGLADTPPVYQKNLSTGLETLQIVTPVGEGEKALAALRQAYPDAGFEVKGTDVVGATVGREIQRSAIIASLMALFAILVYVAFRYEFSFAIASVIAIIHDVLIALSIYFLTGRQLTAPMIAAILTIIGYSINDKIVIMDRIREDLKLGVRGSFKDLIDLALNQTLSRTIITGGAVILATLSLLIFGGGVINDFAFTFLVGVVTGTYSSLFIAAPIVLWWHKGQRPKIGSGPQVAAQAASAVRG